MNPKVKELWLIALRSGNYAQGRRRLRVGDLYCCLGVLCDIYSQDQWSLVEGSYEYQGATHTLPAAVVEWAGLDERNPMPGGISLAALNDRGASFDEIASVIDKWL